MTKKQKQPMLISGKTEHPLHPGKKLVTRRDFLSSGLLAFGGAVMMPSIFDLSLMRHSAMANEITSGMIPFLIFDCAGGASLSGNWVVTGQEGKTGQPLPSYSELGLANTSKFTVDYRFGAPMAAPLPPEQAPDLMSQIFGVLTNDALLPPEVRACLRMGIICHNSLSDSGSNLLSAVSLVTAAGAQGSRIKNGLGMRQGSSAGNSDVASLMPAYRPMGIQSVENLTMALSYGPAFANLSTGLKDSLAKALSRLSGSQAKTLGGMRLGEQFSALIEAGFLKNKEYTADVGGIDARGDATVAGIYGIDGNSGADSEAVIAATLVKNAIEGNSGPAVITIGGCDYHSGNRTDGDDKDTEIGLHIARALRVAYAKGKKVAFQIFTDGGIYSDPGDRVWRGDANDKSLTVVGILDPAGPREMLSYQLNRYTAGQSADRNHYLGTDPKLVAHAVFLNYLAMNGQLGRYSQIVKDSTIPTSKHDSLLLFPNLA